MNEVNMRFTDPGGPLLPIKVEFNRYRHSPYFCIFFLLGLYTFGILLRSLLRFKCPVMCHYQLIHCRAVDSVSLRHLDRKGLMDGCVCLDGWIYVTQLYGSVCKSICPKEIKETDQNANWQRKESELRYA
jgi:hypothetical protein